MDGKKVLIADIVRTPWGKPEKSLEKFMSSDLSVPCIKKALADVNLQPLDIDQVVFGQAHPTTMPNNIGHYAWLKAELPVEVPGYTVNGNTNSALQALRNAYYLIASGNDNIVMAGAADSYSQAPYVMRDVRNHFFEKDRVIRDSIIEAEVFTQPEPMTRIAQYELAHGVTLTAEEEQFAIDSRAKALKFAEVGKNQMVSISYTDKKKGEIIISDDEFLKLDPVTGPLAPYADGATVTILVSEEAAKAHNIKPIAEVIGIAVDGCNPKDQQKAGALAVKKLLSKEKIEAKDIAVFEIIENSAADVIETIKNIGDCKVVNPFGGSLAYGKNDGAEGLAMLQRLVISLDKGQYGVVCTYTAGGMGMAALIKKI